MTSMPPSVTMSDESAADAADAAAKPSRRRREELEALAAEFVNSRIHVRPAPPPQLSRFMVAAGGAGLLVAIGLIAWLTWPANADAPARTAAPVVNEAELWAKRLEAERERKRAELQRGREYLEKMAAADGALMKDMTARAQNLAARAEVAAPPAPAPAPAPARVAEPTPKTTTAAATPARPERAAVAPAQAPPQQVAKAAPIPVAPATTRETDAQPVVVATAAQCSIHVAELSSSGKLTYADVARMKGARTDDRGHVFTPPLVASGRPVVFEVSPDGCVRIVRSNGR
jgi:outer membrane biosynthesis protein TonB